MTFLDHYSWFDSGICEHPDRVNSGFDRAKCAAAVERLRRNNTWIVETPATPVLFFPHLWYQRMGRFIPDSIAAADVGGELKAAMVARDSGAPTLPRQPASLGDWTAAAQSAFYQKRYPSFAPHNYTEAFSMLPVVAGTDCAFVGPYLAAMPGFSLHEILTSFVLSGMTPLQALQTATLNPAKALRATDSLGTVAAGKIADLVLLDTDPLQDIWNTTKIRAVVANGRYFDRPALDRLLDQAAQAAHRRP